MISADGKISGRVSSVGSVSGGISAKGNISGGMSNQIAWDYEKLKNIPAIEGNKLIGDKTFIQLGLGEITPSDIDEMMIDDLIQNLGGN